MKQATIRVCIHCGDPLVGRQRSYCSDAHRKAHKRQVQRQTGEKLKQFADKNLSALSDEERAALVENLTNFLKWERINANNPHSAAQGKAHALTAAFLQILLDGVDK